MTRFIRIASPLGPLFATTMGGALTGIYFDGGRHAPAIHREWQLDERDPVLRACAAQLAGYFERRRRAFDLPLRATGTPFQQRVWTEIARVPYGETITYAELAQRCDAPGSARAAGAATGRNPLSIVVPCHRVVGSDGALTGYAGGVPRKARLLTMEGALIAAAA